MERINQGSKKTLAEFVRVCPFSKCQSTTNIREDLFSRPISKVLITDFFGSVHKVEIMEKVNITIEFKRKYKNIITSDNKCKDSSCKIEEYETEIDGTDARNLYSYANFFPFD